jgi:hypothetical protein
MIRLTMVTERLRFSNILDVQSSRGLIIARVKCAKPIPLAGRVRGTLLLVSAFGLLYDYLARGVDGLYGRVDSDHGEGSELHNVLASLGDELDSVGVKDLVLFGGGRVFVLVGLNKPDTGFALAEEHGGFQSSRGLIIARVKCAKP